jgi:hypothetical protein
MLAYINSLGLDALPSEMVFCVGGMACSVDRIQQTQVGLRHDRLRGGRSRRPDFTFNLPMAQLLITRQTPVQTSHFPTQRAAI